ncbi:hypothetical protein [Mesorhizobium sp. M1378]|uniref:hypothetical protein n=1 Tax=Mesorhizobium sp. M1378 TaxID=2957092 RepID=UPI00333A6A42
MLSKHLAIIVLTIASFSSGAQALPDGQKIHVEQNLDNHRVAYLDATQVSVSNAHIRLMLSNGWKVDPWWVTLKVHFMSGGQDYRVATLKAKCPASLGGSAHECSYEFDVPNVWSATETITLEGHLWDGCCGVDGDEGWTVPIYTGTF